MTKKKAVEFYRPDEGEWFFLNMKGHLNECCDCGLIHKHNFKVFEYEEGKNGYVRLTKEVKNVVVISQGWRREGMTKARRKELGVVIP
jgi:hypothetical protein